MTVQFRVPTPSSTAVLNLLGVLSVLAIVCAIGALSGNPWWGVLAFGIFGLVFVVAGQNAAGEDAAKVAPVKDIDSARGRKAAAA